MIYIGIFVLCPIWPIEDMYLWVEGNLPYSIGKRKQCFLYIELTYVSDFSLSAKSS